MKGECMMNTKMKHYIREALLLADKSRIYLYH